VPEGALDDYVRRHAPAGSPYHKDRYPHEFSADSGTHLHIAPRAGAEADFIVCDEPLSALDVSIQAQIINLLSDLQRQYGIAYLFISHDLSLWSTSRTASVHDVPARWWNTPQAALFQNPLHPYTPRCFSAIPMPDPTVRNGTISSCRLDPVPATAPRRGSRFHTRCPTA
jgi:peptide/nickel transport system ATP-binding protein